MDITRTRRVASIPQESSSTVTTTGASLIFFKNYSSSSRVVEMCPIKRTPYQEKVIHLAEYLLHNKSLFWRKRKKNIYRYTIHIHELLLQRVIYSYKEFTTEKQLSRKVSGLLKEKRKVGRIESSLKHTSNVWMGLLSSKLSCLPTIILQSKWNQFFLRSRFSSTNNIENDDEK